LPLRALNECCSEKQEWNHGEGSRQHQSPASTDRPLRE
jgi:hypothetical protein